MRETRRFVIAFSVSVVLAGTAHAQTSEQYRLKAAFLYNFAKFVQWPAQSFQNPADPFSICIYGQNPFGDSLAQATAGKTIDGHPIRIRPLGDSQAAGCQILFVSDADRKRVKSTIDRVHGAGVLTVSDEPGFAARGGVINFKIDGNHLKFQINLSAAAEQKLTVSSKLLSLAEII